MIQISADTRRAVVTNKELLTVGSAGIQVQFTLSEDWNTLSKLAVFRVGDDGTKVDVVLGESLTCVVPPEVLTQEDEVLFIGIYGANGQGTVIIPTIWASAGVVKPGTEPNTPAESQPTPEIWAQILGVANDAERTATEAMSMVEAGLQDLSELEGTVETAEAQRQTNEQARVTAEGQRATAENVRTTAETGRVDAESARVTSEQGRVAAEESRIAAENARVSAEASRVTAEEGRVAAEAYREEKYAEYVTTVQGYADAASASATAAAGSATSAAGSASAASTSAGQASSSATAASTSASQASSSASNASASATTASNAATTATTQAGIATTKAGEAAQSATAASGSATAAASAKTDAEAAQAAAEEAAESIEESAAQIAQNTQDISDVKNAINEIAYKPWSKTEVGLLDQIGSVIAFTTDSGGMLWDQLIASLRNKLPIEYFDVTWSGVDHVTGTMPTRAAENSQLTITISPSFGYQITSLLAVMGGNTYTGTAAGSAYTLTIPDVTDDIAVTVETQSITVETIYSAKNLVFSGSGPEQIINTGFVFDNTSTAYSYTGDWTLMCKAHSTATGNAWYGTVFRTVGGRLLKFDDTNRSNIEVLHNDVTTENWIRNAMVGVVITHRAYVADKLTVYTVVNGAVVETEVTAGNIAYYINSSESCELKLGEAGSSAYFTGTIEDITIYKAIVDTATIETYLLGG